MFVTHTGLLEAGRENVFSKKLFLRSIQKTLQCVKKAVMMFLENKLHHLDIGQKFVN